MTTVIGVSFKRAGKMYYFDPNGMEMHIGDQVIVETARGMECGDVVTEIRQVEDEEVVQPLKAVIRLATDEDRKRIAINTKKEGEAFEIGQARILHHQLEMKLVDVEYTFDVSKIIFYFTANGRIDFRELVKDLASIFKTRIELRQIGVRDEAKMIGGLGSCGRPICCRTFLGDFQPVSIKMAKEQNLLLNPTKISGLCGRLMCCLKYEQDTYDEVYKRVPKVGKEVVTPDGRGTVAEIAVIREKIRVRISVKDGVTEFREYDFDQVQLAPKDGSPVQLPAPAVVPEQSEVQENAAEITDEEIAAVAALMDETDEQAQQKSDRPRSRGGRGRGGRGRRENGAVHTEESAEQKGPREKGEKRELREGNPRRENRENREKREPREKNEGQPREHKENHERRENAGNTANRPPRPPRQHKPQQDKPQQPKAEGQPAEQPKPEANKGEGQNRNRRRNNRPRRNSGDPNAVRTIPKEQRPE